MNDIKTRRVVFGTLATIFLCAFAALFAYLAFFDPLNERGQSLFVPYLGLSAFLFLAAADFVVITVLAAQQKFLTTPRSNARLMRLVSIAIFSILIIDTFSTVMSEIQTHDWFILSGLAVAWFIVLLPLWRPIRKR